MTTATSRVGLAAALEEFGEADSADLFYELGLELPAGSACPRSLQLVPGQSTAAD